MSDSPYSLRALGEALNKQGYLVVGLRAPGHGTAPSGLRYVSWQDMAAAVKLGMRHLSRELGSKPLHIIGYSTGASLALDYALEALEDSELPAPSGLVLISPAIRVHSAAAIARFKDALSGIPGLDSLAYLTVMDEFDPYKYNSFATNAGAQVHRITSSVDRRIREMSAVPGALDRLPPILVLKSAVDSTVTTDAVVDNLLIHFNAGRNELVLFDINRNSAVMSTLMVSNPGPLTNRLLQDDRLPFAFSVVTNEHEHSTDVVVRHKDPYSAKLSHADPLGLAWPREVISLSHVALPVAPDDPLYGRYPSEDNRRVYLGFLGLKGERGLLSIPADWLLRMRYNPFYPYLESRVIGWLDQTGE
jgi:pimeloyl-ACP methyl ester carboxylesterase